jgi:putative two-component system response regulator
VQSPGQQLLQHLLTSGLVRNTDWEALPALQRQRLSAATEVNRVLDQLLMLDLLTGYQAGRIRAKKPQWLMFGNYRVLNRLGGGSLGVVFKAEHMETRQPVAIKVLVPTAAQESSPLLEMLAERQTVARVRHPHIARVLDVGEAHSDDPECPVIYYYVMEYVTGTDLEQRVRAKGPLSVDVACDVAYQVAAALAAAHQQQLVHRDLKPSNILLTDNGQAKLLDFGLIHSFNAVVGGAPVSPSRPEFLAPEQADDAATVDIRTDLYSLGATLYWSLTAKAPFPVNSSWRQALPERAKQTAPTLKEWGVEAPDLLQALLDRLLAFRPEDRPAQPADVLEVLPMLRPASSAVVEPASPEKVHEPMRTGAAVLVIDADKETRALCRLALDEDGLTTDLAANGKAGMEMILAGSYHVLVLAAQMPDFSGLDLLQYLRKHPPRPHFKIIVLCDSVEPKAIGGVLTAGADDYLTKPLDPIQLGMRVKAALHLQQSQDQAVPVLAAADTQVSEAAVPERPPIGWWRPLSWLFGRSAVCSSKVWRKTGGCHPDVPTPAGLSGS